MPFGISHSKEIRDEVNLDTQTKLSYLILELGAKPKHIAKPKLLCEPGPKDDNR